MSVFGASLAVFYFAILDNETYFDNIFHPMILFLNANAGLPKTNSENTGGNGTRAST